MNRIRKKVVLDALKYCLAFAPVLYIGYFLDVGITSYSAGITGRFFNAALSNQHAQAEGLLGTLLKTLLVAVVALPLFALATSIVVFYFALKHDFYLTSTCYRKTYEHMNGFSAARLCSDWIGTRFSCAR